ncbi:hypothetical protein TWF730_007985 [Orbilia blumenaviensis]|uniref:Uncharacterized protein n=1 Tax=Orbilia blumenaviensis TaxID=1796055 RepID=A0AAV9V9L7_9PEZI
MHIHRRAPQLVSPVWVNPSDPPAAASDDDNHIPPEYQQEKVEKEETLANRGAESSAVSNSSADADPEAGEVVSHRLDQTYPDIPRPTPIKVQSNGDSNPPPPATDMADSGGTIDNNGDEKLIESDSDSDAEDVDGNDEKLKEIEDIAKTISLPGLPLGMLGPVIGAPNSIASGPDGDEGVVEIEVMPNTNGMLDFPLGGSALNNNNNMVEEIWITTDDSSAGGPPGGEGFNPLDMLANQLENIMGGIFGSAPPKQKPEFGQPIDEVMLPSGLAQKEPEVPMAIGAGPGPSSPGTATPAATADGEGTVRAEWGGMGKVVGIVMVSVIGPIIAITALGCGIAFLVKRARAKRRGYREVQTGLCGDEEWN